MYLYAEFLLFFGVLSCDLQFSSTMEATKMTVAVTYAQGWKTDA